MSDTLGEASIELIIQTLYALYILLIIFVPIILGFFFWRFWIRYVRMQFLNEQKHVVLEFRLPKEITKSPVAMEVFINTLYQTSGEGNWFDKFWKGGMRAWFSLEMVSLEGQVHFFIWARSNLKKIIETQLYSQYPDVEITEVEDYTKEVTLDQTK